MGKYWLVAIGGGIGTLMRFGISEWINGMGLWDPLAILIINVSGCFLISFLSSVSDPSGEFSLGPEPGFFYWPGYAGATLLSVRSVCFPSTQYGIPTTRTCG